MAGAVIRLAELGLYDPSDHFDGPWETLEVRRLKPGEAWTCSAETAESGVYVVAGGGTAHIASQPVALQEGTSLMFVRGSRATIVADDHGLELFIARVRFVQ